MRFRLFGRVLHGDSSGLLAWVRSSAGGVPVLGLAGLYVEVHPTLGERTPAVFFFVLVWLSAVDAFVVRGDGEAVFIELDRVVFEVGDGALNGVELLPLGQVLHVGAVAGEGAGELALAVLHLELRVTHRPVGVPGVVHHGKRTLPLNGSRIRFRVDCALATGDLNEVARLLGFVAVPRVEPLAFRGLALVVPRDRLRAAISGGAQDLDVALFRAEQLLSFGIFL